MEGLLTLVIFLFLITFGPPVALFIVGLVKWKKNRNAALKYLIVAAVWFIVGGGLCASMMTGGL